MWMKNTVANNVCMLLGLAIGLVGCDSEQPIKDSTSTAHWFEQGQNRVEQRAQYKKQQLTSSFADRSIVPAHSPVTHSAKNVIFVLGDGMGVSTLTAARIFVGQLQGLMGEEFWLSFEQFPYSALVKTYNVDLQTPDSAGTMSALMTGVKTNEGIISLPDSAQRGECHVADKAVQEIPTLMDHAKAQGKSTAMVTTARVTHATPATTYAHSSDRNWESDDTLPQVAKDLGCQDIARQWVDAKHPSLDILFGGGRRHFLPKELGGKRLDQRDLIQDWQQKGHYVSTLQELNVLVEKSVDMSPQSIKPWLGLFSNSHMEYVHQRPTEQPSLQQMTAAALNRLKRNSNGYALVIEAGRIDHGHHDGMAYKALTETQELHETVEWLLTQVDLSETLIVVTADHSHTLTIAGYTTRGNPILGHVVGNDLHGRPETEASLDQHGQPYTSLSYRDGPGAISSRVAKEEDIYSPEYQQIALVPMDYETHGGEDVALYAIGPMAELFSGTLEQNWVFHALKYAINPNE